MSSNATSIPPASKTSGPSTVPSSFQSSSHSGIDIPQKRSNSAGGFGTGTQTRQVSQPRNNQNQRKQNKSSKKAKLVDYDASELAAMKSVNSRKGQTSITHLMNFSLPPRPHVQHQHLPYRPHQRRNRTWGLGSGYHAVDKARYVHANYRFIVRPDREYHTQTVDADVYVGWDAVLQILVSAETQASTCPICLSEPVAPRMSKCGHIFCLPCLIRYMHSTDETHTMPEKRARWKKCPICEDSIYMSEIRPVRWFQGQEASMLSEGGDVLLRLLKRDPGTTLALPRDAADSYGRHEDIPWYHAAEMMDYARFMKGGEDYITDQYDQELEALEEQERLDELMYGDDTTWIKKAMNSIEDSKTKMTGLENPPPIIESMPNERSKTPVPETWDQNTSPTSANGSSTLTAAIERMNLRSSNTASSKSRTSFYFYNALPNFFLSPLDIRILKAAYGDFSSFPSTVLPRVEHISTGHVVDDDLRKRAKYMAHLPYGFEVNFLECDWTDIINPAILEQFSEEISKRRKRNHEKEAREERDRIRAEREEDEKRWAAARRKRPSMTEKSFSETDFVPLISMNGSPAAESETALSQTPPWGAGRTHSSFATLGSPGTSPEGVRTVWGTTVIASATPPERLPSARPPPDDGWLQGWEKDLMDEADAVAMVEASIKSDQNTKPTTTGSGKKGKKKKITLMSTNARRGA